LVENNEFYIAYGKDALFLANDFHGTMQILSKLPSPPGEYVNIRPQSLEKLLKFVIFDQSRAVEIYARNGDNWVLDKKASPGNLQNFENILFSDPSRTQSSIILALNVQGTHVAAAFVDTVAQVMYVSEFIDNENFADLEVTILNIWRF
jgi:DNA mismatch repair protein MSH2